MFYFFGEVKTKDIGIFIVVPEAKGLLFFDMFSIFEVVCQQVRNYLILFISIDIHIFQNFRSLMKMLFIVDNDVDLS